MKKFVVSCIVAILLIGMASAAIADPITVDLSKMTPLELDQFKKTVQAEYDRATDFPSGERKKLEENLKSIFEQLRPNGTTYSYPWGSFSNQRARSMYRLYDTITVKYADKSRTTYRVNVYYWYDEAENRYKLALFLIDDAIAYSDNNALSHIQMYMDQATLNKLGSMIAAGNPDIDVAIPTPTPTPKPIEYTTADFPNIKYEDSYRYPDKYKGKNVSFTGTVVQVMEGWFGYKYYRIATNGSSNDIVYVTVDGKHSDVNLMEKDRVTIYGVYDGNYSYKTVLGSQVTIPSVEAHKIVLK